MVQQQLSLDVRSGYLFLFINRRGDRMVPALPEPPRQKLPVQDGVAAVTPAQKPSSTTSDDGTEAPDVSR